MAVAASASMTRALHRVCADSGDAVAAMDDLDDGRLEGWLSGLGEVRAAVLESLAPSCAAAGDGLLPRGELECVQTLTRLARSAGRFLSGRRRGGMICVIRQREATDAANGLAGESMAALVRCAAAELSFYGVGVWGVLIGADDREAADGTGDCLADAARLIRVLACSAPRTSTGEVFIVAGGQVGRVGPPTAERVLVRSDRRLLAREVAGAVPSALGLPAAAGRFRRGDAGQGSGPEKVAIVTGGGRGIGRAVAIGLAAQGTNVMVADLGCDADGRGQDPSPASEVADQIRRQGWNAAAACVDVSCAEQCRDLIERTMRTFGRVDVLCHAAGIVRQALIGESTDDDWDRVLGVHVFGARNLVDACLAPMRQHGYGRIVLFSSRSVAGSPGLSVYSAAKGAVLAYGRALARQTEGEGICVNLVLCSGRTRTSMPDKPSARRQRIELLRARYHGLSDPVAYRESAEQDPENNVPMIGWLCSEQAGAVTGHIFGTGGWSVEHYRGSAITASIRRSGRLTMADLTALLGG